MHTNGFLKDLYKTLHINANLNSINGAIDLKQINYLILMQDTRTCEFNVS